MEATQGAERGSAKAGSLVAALLDCGHCGLPEHRVAEGKLGVAGRVVLLCGITAGRSPGASSLPCAGAQAMLCALQALSYASELSKATNPSSMKC